MHNPFLKLASVLGIAGICILVILQIQRGLMNADASVAENSADAAVEQGDGEAPPESESTGGGDPQSFAADETRGGTFPEPALTPNQLEPAPFPDEFSADDAPSGLQSGPLDMNQIQLAHSETAQPFPEEPAFPEPDAFPDPEPTDIGPGIDFRDEPDASTEDGQPLLRAPEEQPSEEFNPQPEPADWPDFAGNASPDAAAETDDQSAATLPEFGNDPEPEVAFPAESPDEAGAPEIVEGGTDTPQLESDSENSIPGPNLFAPETEPEIADEPSPERNVPQEMERELPSFGVAAEPQPPADEPQPADLAAEDGFDQSAPFPDAPELVESDTEGMAVDEAPEFQQPGGPPRRLAPFPSEAAPEQSGFPADLAPEPAPLEPEPADTFNDRPEPPPDFSVGEENTAGPVSSRPLPDSELTNEPQPQLQPVPDSVAQDATGQQLGAPLSPRDAAGFTTPAAHSERPVVTLERPSPQNAGAGQVLIYSMVVKNAGTLAAHDVVVKDRVPEDVQLTGTIPQAVLSGDRLFWRLGTLEPGEQRKISLRVIPQHARVVESTAEVRFSNDYPVETAKAEPDLHVQINVQKQAKLGEDVAFRFVVENRGQADATAVTIQHVMSDGFQHRHGRDLEYSLDTVPAGETREAQLVLRATQAGPLQTYTTVTANGNIAIERTTTITVANQPLVIQRISTDGHALGRPTVLQNRVTNQTGQTIVGATVVEILPTSFEFVAASDGGQFNPNTRTIAWPVGQLGAGESKDLKVKLVPKAAGAQTSVIRVIDGSGRQMETTVRTNVGD